LLDIGCNDGRATLNLIGAETAKKLELHGLEVVPEMAAKASERGIQVEIGNADKPFPFGANEFDVITANQLIEHLQNQDAFLDEVYRVLKPGGFLLLCTPNLASWHNVVALFMGWQPFPMTIYSEKRAGIGNPITLHRGEDVEHVAMLHTRVYTLRAMRELLELHDFKILEASGSGYYPFPASIATRMTHLDPTHSVIQFIKAAK